MTIPDLSRFNVFLRLYVSAALIAAVIISPLAFSFVPVLLLIWYLVQWRWGFSQLIGLVTHYFIFFALNLLFASQLGSFWPLLIALPDLGLIDTALVGMAREQNRRVTRFSRSPTKLLVLAAAVIGLILLIAVFLKIVNLVLASTVLVCYFGLILFFIYGYLGPKSIQFKQLQLRTITGTEVKADIKFEVKTKIAALLFTECPEEWVKIHPKLSLKGGESSIGFSALPKLSGPQVLELTGYVIDRWGLTQLKFKQAAVDLMVIPRARYAEWLVRRYMKGTNPGDIPLISNLGAIKPMFGLRRGTEYYGNQMYQAGDSLKNIDWKHSYKYNQLISKKFSELTGQSAIVLINLVSGDEEEKDILAYNILVTALSLTQENIPSSLAVYTDKSAVMTTEILTPQRMMLHCLRLVKDIVVVPSPTKYLEDPDLQRLKGNIRRMHSSGIQPIGKLRELLQFEYKSISRASQNNPSTLALLDAQAKISQQANIVIISRRNHDAEALAFNSYLLAQKGIATIFV